MGALLLYILTVV